MQHFLDFLLSVVASVIGNYISKRLIRDDGNQPEE